MCLQPVAGRQISFLVDPSRVYRWHLWLADALKQKGHKVRFYRTDLARRNGFSSDMLLKLERIIYRMSGEHASDVLSAQEVAREISPEKFGTKHFPDNMDVLVDFVGTDVDPGIAKRVLTPLFDGFVGDLGAYAALYDGRNVEIRIIDTAQKDRTWSTRPAIDEKRVMARSLDNIFSRAVEMLTQVVVGNGAQSSFSASTPREFSDGFAKLPPMTVDAASHLTRGLASKLKQRLMRVMTTGDRWAAAWREVSDDGLITSQKGASALYNLIPDDGQRYFADPFVFQKDGLTYIFVEEYPFDTLKGIISVFTLDEKGKLSEPRVVLERPYHLSYPFVFERDGQIWMIPEAGDSRSVEIYRAVEFPFKWEREGALLDDVAGYDVTICDYEDRMWMFLTTRCHQSTSWDNLLLYHSDKLLGEWKPHAKNPVLVDGHVSRPGGQMVMHKGKLLRPAQDGSRLYGGGLSICRVDHMDRDDFAQTLIGSMETTGPDSVHGIHTINRMGNIEVVDVLGSMEPDCNKISVSYKTKKHHS